MDFALNDDHLALRDAVQRFAAVSCARRPASARKKWPSALS